VTSEQDLISMKFVSYLDELQSSKNEIQLLNTMAVLFIRASSVAVLTNVQLRHF
jgi:hypothetical protein